MQRFHAGSNGVIDTVLPSMLKAQDWIPSTWWAILVIPAFQSKRIKSWCGLSGVLLWQTPVSVCVCVCTRTLSQNCFYFILSYVYEYFFPACVSALFVNLVLRMSDLQERVLRTGLHVARHHVGTGN